MSLSDVDRGRVVGHAVVAASLDGHGPTGLSTGEGEGNHGGGVCSEFGRPVGLSGRTLRYREDPGKARGDERAGGAGTVLGLARRTSGEPRSSVVTVTRRLWARDRVRRLLARSG
jgi:hypothetical protein